jgi:hypothetical protein
VRFRLLVPLELLGNIEMRDELAVHRPKAEQAAETKMTGQERKERDHIMSDTKQSLTSLSSSSKSLASPFCRFFFFCGHKRRKQQLEAEASDANL